MNEKLRVAVCGVGAVGGYFGGRLAEAGHDVTFLARGETLAALHRDGLRVESIDGDFSIQPAKATDQPATIGPVDLVVLAVKAWQVPRVAETLTPLMGPDSAVLPLQNGVEAPDEISRALGAEHALGGLAKIIAFRTEPALIRHLGAQPYIALGELDDSSSSRVERIARAFSETGVVVDLPDDIRAALWAKFVFITAVSGVGAATHLTIGEIREHPRSRQLLVESMRETMALATARGVDSDPELLASTMDFVDSLPPEGTASMQRDIAEGLPSELEAQTGAIVRMAEALDVPVPVNRVLYGLLAPLEARARKATGSA